MIKFFKVLNEDGSPNLIGTSENILEGIEITETEYNDLRQAIINNAVHLEPLPEDLMMEEENV